MTQKIFQVDSSRERVVHTHDTYVRDIAFDQNDTLYFSEATGAGGDGRIYSMQRGNPSLFAEIRLDDIGGYWSADFAFDTHHNLYISTGNRIPASIYRRNRGWEEIHREESDALSEGDPNYDAVCDYRDTLDGWPSISEFAYMFRTYGGFCWGGRCTCMCKAQLFATLLCRVGIPRDRITVAGAHYN